MSNALNVRLINNVTTIAQGDNASTVILELLDNDRMLMPYLNGRTALVNFIDGKNEIQYQVTSPVFDSRIEFNIDAVIPAGKYNVEVRIEYDGASYVFPSSLDYILKVNKSANEFYNVVISVDGLDVVVNEVYRKLESENPGLLEHVHRKDNPHEVTKEQIGLGNVDNVQQASKEDFDEHAGNQNIHVTTDDKDNWNNKATQGDIDRAIQELDFPETEQLNSHIANSEVHFVDEEKRELNETIQDLESQVNSLRDIIDNIPDAQTEDIQLELSSGIDGVDFYGTSAFIRNNIAYITTMMITPNEGSLGGTHIIVEGLPENKRFRTFYSFGQRDAGSFDFKSVLVSSSFSSSRNNIRIGGSELEHGVAYTFSIVIPLAER